MSDVIRIEIENIVSIDSTGITVKNGEADVVINFEECTENFKKLGSFENDRCVATTDITKPAFTFFTEPRTEVIFKKRFFKDLFRKSATVRFLDLYEAIKTHGYSCYDLSDAIMLLSYFEKHQNK